jgi:NAD/NADP transhydrogenase beta subunit
MPGYYPANALKNRALYLAPTEYLVMLDANFVVTPSVVGSPAQTSEPGLPSKEELQVRLLNKNEVIVVPGYQLANTGQDLTIARIVARDLATGEDNFYF